jgi:hypothetical protein
MPSTVTDVARSCDAEVVVYIPGKLICLCTGYWEMRDWEMRSKQLKHELVGAREFCSLVGSGSYAFQIFVRRLRCGLWSPLQASQGKSVSLAGTILRQPEFGQVPGSVRCQRVCRNGLRRITPCKLIIYLQKYKFCFCNLLFTPNCYIHKDN